MGRFMINYSTFMWKNTLDKKGVEQAYAKNQVTKVVAFDEFVKHISDHNGVFTRGTVKGKRHLRLSGGTTAERL